MLLLLLLLVMVMVMVVVMLLLWTLLYDVFFVWLPALCGAVCRADGRGKMADDSQTCCTVETPSRLMLFYPADTTPAPLASLLPLQPLSRSVGQRLTLGRSSSADVRLNDERMSRLYAALWHAGDDPFVFRVSNLSQRKLLLVDGAMLRYEEEAEVKDGCVLTLDFLQLKAKVCAGDYVASSYEVSFVKNVVMTPPVSQKPPGGKCLMPPRRDADKTRRMSLDNAGDVVSKLLTCLQTGSLDYDSRMAGPPSVGVISREPYLASRHSSDPGDVGVEYELPENVSSATPGFCSSAAEPPSGLSAVSLSPSAYRTGNKLSLNIPPPPALLPAAGQRTASTGTATPQQQEPELRGPASSPAAEGQNQTSSAKRSLSCWFNLDHASVSPVHIPHKEKLESVASQDLPEIAQHVQDALLNSKISSYKARPSCCRGCAGDVSGKTAAALKPAPEMTQKLTLPDMVADQSLYRKSPVENAEWDTDDPNINCYME